MYNLSSQKFVCAFEIGLDREIDGRWIAEVAELPGVLSYGNNQQEAVTAAKVLALRALADRLEHAREET